MTVPTFRTIPGDRPLRTVLVGAGSMGRAWLRTLRASPLVELVGVVDVHEASARAAVAGSGGAGVIAGTALREVAEECSAEMVVDVTIPDAHYPVTLEALGLGLPVLGEKPMAADLTQAVALVAAAEAAGELFMVSQNRRFNRHLYDLKAQVGQVGEVGILVHEFFRAPRFGGFRDVMDHPLLLDMAIHNFDAARFLLDADPVAVYCEEYNPPWSWYRGDAAATAVFEMTGGIRYLYTGSWCSGGLETSWNGTWRVSGRHGSAVWDGDGPPRLELAGAAPPDGHGAGSPADPGGNGQHPPAEDLAGALAAFVDALRTGGVPSGECHDNLLTLAMVHAATASATAGGRVQVADVLQAARAGAAEVG